MNDPKFVEKVAEEIWVVRQEYCKNPNILGLDYDPMSWHELHEILKGAYRVMASRAIDVVNQEIAYGTRVNIPAELFTEEHD